MRKIYLLFLLIITSCGVSNDSDQETVEITVIDMADNLKTRIIGVLTTIENNDRIQYGYNENPQDSTFDYSISRNLDNDSLIVYDDGDEICHLTGVKKYIIENREVTVKRYLYDVAGVFDEEARFFIIDNYGLIAIDVLDGNQLFFDKGPGSGKSIIEYLRSDTLFFRPKVPPPPMPVDFDQKELEMELDTLVK